MMLTALKPAKFPWFDYSRYSFSLGVKSAVGTYLSGHTGSVFQAVWNLSGSRLATASSDGTTRLWNSADGTEVRVLEGNPSVGVIFLAWNKAGTQLVTADLEGTAWVWGTEMRSTPISSCCACCLGVWIHCRAP